jgi:hypothetical protein
VEPSIEVKTPAVRESKPASPKKTGRNLLAEIFEGHEEFLGLTPD